MKSRKTKGQVFTPHHIVSIMLDTCGYTRGRILHKHIIDNSCGDGAFLRQAVERYCDEALENGISGEMPVGELCVLAQGLPSFSTTMNSFAKNCTTPLNLYKTCIIYVP